MLEYYNESTITLLNIDISESCEDQELSLSNRDTHERDYAFDAKSLGNREGIPSRFERFSR